ncbi:MAG: helix-turn-helix domain-containing protein [Candidatus Buchananbacteria bacterium]
MVNKILKELGISDTAGKIYLKLAATNYLSARQLAESLGLPRATIYDNLNILIKNNLVIEKEQNGKKLFNISEPNELDKLLDNKIDNLNQAKKKIKDWQITLKLSPAFAPKIKFYSGADGIKQVLKDMLWYENIETYTMWPISDMVDILGREYLENLNRKRIKRKISIKGIWPANKTVKLKEYPFLGVGSGHLRQLRIAPSSMDWDMSYWLYSDKIAFISSKAENFGFVVHSKDFTNLMKQQFEVIWKISKPVAAQPKYTNSFLKTV